MGDAERRPLSDILLVGDWIIATSPRPQLIILNPYDILLYVIAGQNSDELENNKTREVT